MIFDTGDAEALKAAGLDGALLADLSWRDQMIATGEAHTQRFARMLIAEGYNGLLVRSFTKGAGPGGKNLALWKWNASGQSRLELIDNEEGLG